MLNEGTPNRWAPGGCGVEPAGLTQASILYTLPGQHGKAFGAFGAGGRYALLEERLLSQLFPSRSGLLSVLLTAYRETLVS